MKNGIELIKKEREDQIKKHGFTLSSDKEYKNGELLMAAKFCLMPKNHNSDWPQGWKTHFKYKILENSRIDQLKKAGAFYMAQNDLDESNTHDEKINEIASEIDVLLKEDKVYTHRIFIDNQWHKDFESHDAADNYVWDELKNRHGKVEVTTIVNQPCA